MNFILPNKSVKGLESVYLDILDAEDLNQNTYGFR